MLNFSKIKLKEIHPSIYNPRKISTKEQKILHKNLEKFGLVDPIIINLKNNRIIGGHQRYEVLTQIYDKSTEFNLLRLGDVGWLINETSLKINTLNEEKALNLALNKISGRWDYSKLILLLKNLEKEGFDLNLTGFKEVELDLFDKNKKIEFNEDIFNFDDIVPKEQCTCPKCGHIFLR